MKKVVSIICIIILVLSLSIISFATSGHYTIDTSKIDINSNNFSGEINEKNSDGLKQWTISFDIYKDRNARGNVAEIINQYCAEKKCIPVDVSTIVVDDSGFITVIAVVSKK